MRVIRCLFVLAMIFYITAAVSSETNQEQSNIQSFDSPIAVKMVTKMNQANDLNVTKLGETLNSTLNGTLTSSSSLIYNQFVLNLICFSLFSLLISSIFN